MWINKDGQHYSLDLKDHAQRKGDDIVFLEFPGTEGIIKAGDLIASLEMLRLYST